MSDDDPRLLRSDNGTKNLHRNIFDETKLLCHFLVTLLFRTQDGVSETEKIIPKRPRWKPRWLTVPLTHVPTADIEPFLTFHWV